MCLGTLQAPEAVEPLAELLDRSVSAGVRAASAQALGEIGDERAVPALASALADESWEVIGGEHFYRVRRRAEEALQKIGTLDARRALRRGSDA